MNADVGATDTGIGYAILIGFVALGGVAAMYLGAGHELAGWGFALAMLAGAAAVAVLHLVEGR